MSNQNKSSDTKQPFYAKWANFPFAPAGFPFFYGWVIVIIATLSIICSIPGQTAGVGIFTDYIINSIGVSRNQLSLAYMIGTLISGFLLPFAGRLLDFIGVRLMGIFASMGLALSLILMSELNALKSMLDLIFSPHVSAMIAASFTFLLIRFFGQGNLPMIGRVAMGRWFNRNRGIATAISGVPASFAFSGAPWILNQIILGLGWQQACWFLAGTVGLGMASISFLFFRDNPEECGLTMDGNGNQEEAEKKRPNLHPIYKDFERNEAILSLPFWAVSLVLSLHGMIITAVSFHITSFGDEMGKSISQAVLIFFYSSFIALPVRFITGYLIDKTKIPLSWILAALSLAIAGYMVGFIWFDSVFGFYTSILMLGLTAGVWGLIADNALPRFYGRKNLGSISSVTMSAMVISSAMGPVVFSFGKILLGSYKMVLLFALVLPAISFFLSMFASNPQNKFADTEN